MRGVHVHGPFVIEHLRFVGFFYYLFLLLLLFLFLFLFVVRWVYTEVNDDHESPANGIIKI